MFLFLANIASTMCLMIFSKGKKPFQTIKNRKLKKSKIGIFPKGLVHGFGEKFENFPSFFFLAKSASKMCLKIFQKGKKLFQTMKKRKLKSQKLEFFQGGQSKALVKNLKIFRLFSFGKISQHNMFDYILERKQGFLDYKKQKVKTVKNWDFSKGVSPWFWSKI